MTTLSYWAAIGATIIGIVINVLFWGKPKEWNMKTIEEISVILTAVTPGVFFLFNLLETNRKAMRSLLAAMREAEAVDKIKEHVLSVLNVRFLDGAVRHSEIVSRALAQTTQRQHRETQRQQTKIVDFIEGRADSVRVPEFEPTSEIMLAIARMLKGGGIWMGTVKSSMGFGEIATPMFRQFDTAVQTLSCEGKLSVARLYYLPVSNMAEELTARAPSSARSAELLEEIDTSMAKGIEVKVQQVDDVDEYNERKEDFSIIFEPRNQWRLLGPRALTAGAVAKLLEEAESGDVVLAKLSDFSPVCIVTWGIGPPTSKSQVEYIEIKRFTSEIGVQYLSRLMMDWKAARRVPQASDGGNVTRLGRYPRL